VIFLSYCPLASEEEFAESVDTAGALQTLTEVRKVDHAEPLVDCQVWRAAFIDAEKAAQAALTAFLMALPPGVKL